MHAYRVVSRRSSYVSTDGTLHVKLCWRELLGHGEHLHFSLQNPCSVADSELHDSSFDQGWKKHPVPLSYVGTSLGF